MSAGRVPRLWLFHPPDWQLPLSSAVIDRRYSRARCDRGRRLQLQRVRLQFFERDKFQRRRVRRFEIDGRSNAVLERILPSCHAHAPFVARLESGKIPFRMRRDEIVAIEHGKIEELTRHLRAHGMQPDIARSGAAESIPIKSGERITAARFQLSSENVCRHWRTITQQKELSLPGKR